MPVPCNAIDCSMMILMYATETDACFLVFLASFKQYVYYRSDGEGLGNQFLATIRQCDAIVHVVRCFEDENVIHVDGSVDPVRDAELINLELALADLAQVEKRMQRVEKERKADSKEGQALEKLAAVLNNNEPARNAELDEEEELEIKSLGLLTRKKMIYAANVADSQC